MSPSLLAAGAMLAVAIIIALSWARHSAVEEKREGTLRAAAQALGFAPREASDHSLKARLTSVDAYPTLFEGTAQPWARIVGLFERQIEGRWVLIADLFEERDQSTYGVTLALFQVSHPVQQLSWRRGPWEVTGDALWVYARKARKRSFWFPREVHDQVPAEELGAWLEEARGVVREALAAQPPVLEPAQR